MEQGKKKFFLLGSDYVFPRTANKIIKAQLEAKGGDAGRRGVHAARRAPSSARSSARSRRPSPTSIFNTLNGDSNVAFFKQFKDAGFTRRHRCRRSRSASPRKRCAASAPRTSPATCVAWNYYQTTDTPENEKFVAAYKAKYGDDRVTDDPIEAGYFGVYLWKLAVEKAGSTEVDSRQGGGQAASSSPRPRAWSRSTARTSTSARRCASARSAPDGLIDEVWSTGEPVEPDPYLKQLRLGRVVGEPVAASPERRSRREHGLRGRRRRACPAHAGLAAQIR